MSQITTKLQPVLTNILDLESINHTEGGINEDLIECMEAAILDAGYCPFPIVVWQCYFDVWQVPPSAFMNTVFLAIDSLNKKGQHIDQCTVVIAEDEEHAIKLLNFFPCWD
jgi:hypothetical protein